MLRSSSIAAITLLAAATGCDAGKPPPARSYGCSCEFLTDTDDLSTQKVTVCAASLAVAEASAVGCAQSGAPAPVQACRCAEQAGACTVGDCTVAAER